MKNHSESKRAYLDKFVFFGLYNINDGFDSKAISYFSEADFRTILERIEKLGIGIYGIEPWIGGTFYDVHSFEEYSNDPCDPKWFWKAFDDFISTGETLQYASTYYIPQIEDRI